MAEENLLRSKKRGFKISDSFFRNWFTFSGRRKRLSYFLACIPLQILVIPSYFFEWNLGNDPIVTNPALTGEFILRLAFIAFLLTFYLILTIAWMAISAQRLRDLGVAGWSVGFIIPFAAIPEPVFYGIEYVFMLTLSLLPGQTGPNQFGPDPAHPWIRR